MNDNWKFDGTIWDFIETIQWALVIREASKRNDPDIGIIMTTPNLQSSAFNKQRQFEELLSFSRRLNSC